MPPLAYFLGKIGVVLVTSVVQFAVLLLVSWLFFGLELPASAALWVRFAWIFGLGIAAGTTLGIAYSSLARSSRSAAAVVSPVVIVLQFISGIFFVYSELPRGCSRWAPSSR
jgi:ABC-2 type transport system permease protein